MSGEAKAGGDETAEDSIQRWKVAGEAFGSVAQGP